MDKLISAEKLIKDLENFCGNQEYLISENVWEIIRNQPTAFDKSKVIEDLTDWKNDAEKWAAKFDEIGDTDNMDIQDAMVRCYENAIKIVLRTG